MGDTEYEVKWPVAMLTYMGYAIVILVHLTSLLFHFFACITSYLLVFVIDWAYS